MNIQIVNGQTFTLVGDSLLVFNKHSATTVCIEGHLLAIIDCFDNQSQINTKKNIIDALSQATDDEAQQDISNYIEESLNLLIKHKVLETLPCN